MEMKILIKTGTRTKTLVERATDMGHDHGVNSGSWFIDGNSSKEFCHKVIDGYDDGDPEVMDYCPSPLSGQWADDPTVLDVLRSLGIPEQKYSKGADFLIDTYEDAFSKAWWDTVIQAAYGQLDYEPCGVCGLYGHKAKEHDQ
jgi:hypothetical protein